MPVVKARAPAARLMRLIAPGSEGEVETAAAVTAARLKGGDLHDAEDVEGLEEMDGSSSAPDAASEWSEWTAMARAISGRLPLLKKLIKTASPCLWEAATGGI